MKYLAILCLLLFSSLFAFSQESDTIQTSERVFVEMSVNISTYNSLSISVEKEFTYGRWKFGPRVELVNLFNDVNYVAEEDSNYSMSAQLRIRLTQIEYQINPRLRVGVAPFWMLGPIPSQGFYKTPTTFYAHLQLKEGFSFEPSITTSSKEFFQFSFRKII